jgi:hypothetical protein
MRLSSAERCQECAWGSTFSNGRIRLHAEFSTWNEEYTAQYLEKQQEYVKEWTEIDGKRAKIQSFALDASVLFGLLGIETIQAKVLR